MKTRKLKWKQGCINNTLKLWGSDTFSTSFQHLKDVVFDFTDQMLGHDFFKDTLDLIKDFCSGHIKQTPWPNEKECLTKYQELRQSPGYFNTLRKICKIAQIDNVFKFEKEFMKLISRYCLLKSKMKQKSLRHYSRFFRK